MKKQWTSNERWVYGADGRVVATCSRREDAALAAKAPLLVRTIRCMVENVRENNGVLDGNIFAMAEDVLKVVDEA